MSLLMGRSVIGFLVLLSFAGCASKTPGRVIGGTMVALGTFSVIATHTSTEEPKTINDGVRMSLNEIGGPIMLITGAVILAFNEFRPASPPAPETAPQGIHRIEGADTIQAPATDDPQLRRLTLQASLAARAGQCSAVRVIADRVGELDSAFRRGGFVADAAIEACL